MLPSDDPRGRNVNLVRRSVMIEGIVQGVGFRPFVYRNAVGLGLSGFVRNQAGSVYLEVEGDAALLDRFVRTLTQHPPPLARVDAIRSKAMLPNGIPGFRISESLRDAASQVCLPADVATCAKCLTELFDVGDRRYLYPFVNCTNCGPRLTIIRDAPYDRQRTTMAQFEMCANCRQEYEDPANRRFDAQPIACPQCGPQLRLLTNRGAVIATADPLRMFGAAIRQGQIGAMKGLGGYHLVCDARSESVVSELRLRKHREQKPFAVMMRNLEQVEALCHVGSAERELLISARRPIVLLRKRDDIDIPVAHSVAPGNPRLGLMLPYTPLHHLLLHELGDSPLVLTSGNRSDEPIAYEDEDAVARLGDIADFILTHNRPIHVRCDDSVMSVIDGKVTALRRARGYAPEPITLPLALPCPTLAVGGQLKSTFALGCERRAFLSPHLGDLDHLAAYQAFEQNLKLFGNLFAIRPELLVHDLHPDYASTVYAERRAAREGLRLLAVQHHHAHIASGMVEHGLDGPVIGVAFDGTGYGTDGAIWGGEFLIAGYGEFQRIAHLRYVGLPGGDAAIRATWRSAAAHLLDAECDLSLLSRTVSAQELRTVEQMIHRQFQTPLTSSMGRLFDAVAAIAGLRTAVNYEGQAAMELEWLAAPAEFGETYSYQVVKVASAESHPQWIIDTRPLIRELVEDVHKNRDRRDVARRFHSTIIEMIVEVCDHLRRHTNMQQIVLSGGVFMNRILAVEATNRLIENGFQVYRQQLVPSNDGGLSLGQLAVAARQRTEGKSDGVSATTHK
jgi:hydrogenase maturation protein HypF